MKALVVFDSFFGNTEKAAVEIARNLGSREEVTVSNIKTIKPEDILSYSLLIVGSPTRAFRPSPGMSVFLKSIKPGSLEGMRTAAFDTRIHENETGSRFITLMMKLFGYAALPIHKSLIKKGGIEVSEPAGFFVNDTKGPLKKGENERAAEWARSIRKVVLSEEEP
ncbi:MAG: flavodoxin family protein [Fibrobacterota bacterium]